MSGLRQTTEARGASTSSPEDNVGEREHLFNFSRYPSEHIEAGKDTADQQVTRMGSACTTPSVDLPAQETEEKENKRPAKDTQKAQGFLSSLPASLPPSCPAALASVSQFPDRHSDEQCEKDYMIIDSLRGDESVKPISPIKTCDKGKVLGSKENFADEDQSDVNSGDSLAEIEVKAACTSSLGLRSSEEEERGESRLNLAPPKLEAEGDEWQCGVCRVIVRGRPKPISNDAGIPKCMACDLKNQSFVQAGVAPPAGVVASIKLGVGAAPANSSTAAPQNLSAGDAGKAALTLGVPARVGLADTPPQNLNMTLSNSERPLELSREEREVREKREKVGGRLEEEVSASNSSNRLSELAAANEAHEAELQALLFQSALLQSAPIREEAKDQKEEVKAEAVQAGARDTQKTGKGSKGLTSLSQLVQLISGMPYVRALALEEDASAHTLASWYAKQQAYLVSMTQMLDQMPERKQEQTRIGRMEKLYKAKAAQEKLEIQLEKELKGRNNRDSVENLLQQITKGRTALARAEQGTAYDGMTSSEVGREVSKQSIKLAALNKQYADAETHTQTLHAEMLELDKEVCKIVKRGFHKASLQHHPDKLGIAAEDLSEVQGGLWRSIQQASVVLSDTSLRREYFDLRDHDKFVTLLEERASGARGVEGSQLWQRRLCGNQPHQCSIPMLCQEDYSSRKKTANIQVIWTCKNAVSLDVTRYELSIQRLQGPRADPSVSSETASSETEKTFETPTPELKIELSLGEYAIRVRAVNIAGYGEWSQRLELVLQAPDVSGYVCRKELLQMAQERARQHRQEEARWNLLNKMSTLAAKHSHAYENLELALKEGLRQGLPVTDDDKFLFERGVQRLAAIEGMQERRQNIKDWKKKILPYPDADLLMELDSSEISAEVSLMMMQHLTKKGKEFAKAKLAGDLAPFDRVRDALKAAEKRPDLFKPHWCMDFQDLARKLKVRVEQERKRRSKEEEKYEKKMAEDRAALAAMNPWLYASNGTEAHQLRHSLEFQRQREREIGQQELQRHEMKTTKREEVLLQQQQQKAAGAHSDDDDDDISMLTGLLLGDTSEHAFSRNLSAAIDFPGDTHQQHAVSLSATVGPAASATMALAGNAPQFNMEKVRQVREVLGNSYGEGFVALMLNSMEESVEAVIQALLDANIPEALMRMDRSAPLRIAFPEIPLASESICNGPAAGVNSRNNHEPEKIQRCSPASGQGSRTNEGAMTDPVLLQRTVEVEKEDANMCNICFEGVCDTMMKPCLHKICSNCVHLVKESTRLMHQREECCPFCRTEIKSFVALYARGVEKPPATSINKGSKEKGTRSHDKQPEPLNNRDRAGKMEQLMEHRIFLTNFGQGGDAWLNRELLMRVFGQYGLVLDAWLPKASKVAFISYEDENVLERVLSLRELEIGGCRVRLVRAHPKGTKGTFAAPAPAAPAAASGQVAASGQKVPKDVSLAPSKTSCLEEGDWLCSKEGCNNMNFAFRNECNRCGTGRPFFAGKARVTGDSQCSPNMPTPEDEWLLKIVSRLLSLKGHCMELGLLANPSFNGVTRPAGVCKNIKLRDVLDKNEQRAGLALSKKGTSSYATIVDLKQAKLLLKSYKRVS